MSSLLDMEKVKLRLPAVSEETGSIIHDACTFRLDMQKWLSTVMTVKVMIINHDTETQNDTMRTYCSMIM